MVLRRRCLVPRLRCAQWVRWALGLWHLLWKCLKYRRLLTRRVVDVLYLYKGKWENFIEGPFVPRAGTDQPLCRTSLTNSILLRRLTLRRKTMVAKFLMALAIGCRAALLRQWSMTWLVCRIAFDALGMERYFLSLVARVVE